MNMHVTSCITTCADVFTRTKRIVFMAHVALLIHTHSTSRLKKGEGKNRQAKR
jgi:hypothetical protein